jgi:hypothetical protein
MTSQTGGFVRLMRKQARKDVDLSKSPSNDHPIVCYRVTYQIAK